MAAPDPFQLSGTVGRSRGTLYRDIGWVFCGKLVTAIAGLTSFVLLSRLLNIGNFASFIMLLSLASFFSLLVQGGLPTTAVKLIAQANSKVIADKAVRAAFVRFAGLAAIFGLLWVLGVGIWITGFFEAAPVSNTAILVTAIWVIFLALQRLIAEIFRGQGHIALASIADGSLYSLLFLLALIVFGLSNTTLSLELVLFSVIGALGLIAMAGLISQRSIFKAKKLTQRHPTTAFTGLALPILAAELAIFFNNQADLWIVAAFLPADAVANYGIALRLALILMMPTVILTGAIAPRIAALKTRPQNYELQQLLHQSAAISAMLSLLILLAFLIFGNGLINIVFGAEFHAAYPILLIMCIGRVVNISSGFCGPCLMLCGHQKAMMRITVLFVMLGMLAGLAAVKHFGAIGVAVSFTTAMALQNIWQARRVRHLLGLSTWLRIVDIKNLILRLRVRKAAF